MNKLLVSLCILYFVMGSPIFAADDAKTVAIADTPAAVQKTVAAQVGDGKVEDINRSMENGETVFEVDFATKAGDDRDFTVADDGTLLSVGVSLADTPAAVQKTIQAQLPGWEITGINKNVADAEISYDVEVSKNGRERSFNVDNNGVLSSVEVDLAETPVAVQAAIKARVGNDTLRSIDEDLDPDGNSFDVEAVAKDGSRKTFSVAPDGRLLSEGVTLDQVPPAARQTIMEKIGNGKILEIDKSLFEKRGNILPYEVQGRKDGKEFDFSVGPRGRFLGMDN
jgi:uncharacterized membrane protein YkoI